MDELFSDAEILSGIGLSELPISGCHVVGCGAAPVAASDSEGQRLAHKHRVGLPVLPPVSAHGHPPGVGAFHAHAHDVSCARHVGDQNQVEVLVAVDCEPDPSLLSAWNPAENNKNKTVKTFMTVVTFLPRLESLKRLV